MNHHTIIISDQYCSASARCMAPGLYQVVWNFSYYDDGTRIGQLYQPYDSDGNAQTPVLTAYFMGEAYEVNGTREDIKP
jgi:hypothetical protein